jgi:3-isopropylmalate/(R)-2-methylmalate dehydratase small subunit
MLLKGRVFKYGDNIDTDVIIPGRYCHLSDSSEIAKHCLEDLDPDFIKNASDGDFIFAGNNFGCGSSREHAPIAIKSAKVGCVVAKSFARIFYRNAINIGLFILECPEAVDATNNGDVVQIDMQTCQIKNLTQNLVFNARPFPDFIRRIINAGGLMNFAKEMLKNDKGI